MTGQVKAYISGIACRFPKSSNVNEFWENLINGVDMLDDNVWPAGLCGLPPRTGHIPDIHMFDAKYFKIPEMEAKHLSVMCRQLLEVVHECIVDTGLTLNDIESSKTGLYLACTFSDLDEVTTSLIADSGWLNVKSELVSQLSQMFGCDGPVVSVDAACTSSFAALDVAVGDLVMGRCKQAIVAGINLVISPNVSLRFHRLNMLSPTGDSHVYDVSANGYVRSDGVAAMFLSSSESTCRRIYASLIDIAINCDGYKEEGITHPGLHSLKSLLQTIYTRTGIKTKDLAYIEMHGSGTQIGDVTETQAVADVLCQDRQQLLVGSVKSNMGHCEAAAGLAGLIKCIMSMHHGILPPSLHFKTPNPKITPIVNGQVCVVDQPTALPDGWVGVNCYGFGGVNGHALLQPYKIKKPEKSLQSQIIIPVTARNEDNFNTISNFISSHGNDENLLHFFTKSLLSCDGKQPIRGVVSIFTDSTVTSKFLHVQEAPPKLWLILNDIAWSTGCIKQEIMSLSAFVQSVSNSDKIVQQLTGDWSLMENMTKEQPPLSRLGLVTRTACLIALRAVLVASHCEISGTIGCGLSEIASAYLTGCLSLAECLQVALTIGEYLEQVKNHTDSTNTELNTYLVNITAEEAYVFSPQVKVIAVLQTSVVMTFHVRNRDLILARLKQKGYAVRDLKCTLPLYSKLMGDMDNLKQKLKKIIKSPKKLSPQFLSASSHIIQPRISVKDDQCDAEYFCQLLQHSYNWKRPALCLPDKLVFITLSAADKYLDIPFSPVPSQSRRTSDDYIMSPEKTSIRTLKGISCGDLLDKKGTKIKKLAERRGSQVSFLKEGLQKRRSSHMWNASDKLITKTSNVTCQSDLATEAICEGIVHCNPDTCSLLNTLAELHLLGFDVNVSHLFKTSAVLDCTAPPLSPLVGWDHIITYPIADWTYFCCQEKDDIDNLYTIPEIDNFKLWDPLVLVLYHICSAISYKLSGKEEALDSIVLSDLHVNFDKLSPATVEDALIEVLVGQKCFCVSPDDGILLRGKYLLPSADMFLPTIPGYDMDVNENMQNSSALSEIETTEILWEDSWLEFLNSVLEFAGQHIKWPLVKVMVNPVKHLEVVKQGASILTMVDAVAGLCKAGCLVLQFKSDTPVSLNQSSCQTDMTSDTHTDDLLISVIVTSTLNSQSHRQNRVMLCLGSKQSDPSKQLMGIIIESDGGLSCCDIPLDIPCHVPDLQMMVPFVLATYILLDAAKASETSSVVVLPPLDTVAIYIIALADQLGCGVYTATWDSEIRADLDAMFPNVRNLSAKNIVAKIRRLTIGQGCDICIKNSGADMSTAVDVVCDGGVIIQTVTPSMSDKFGMNHFLRNISVVAVDPAQAFVTLMKKSVDDVKLLVYNAVSEAIKRLFEEGYPEMKGFTYSLTETWTSSQTIQLQSLLHVLDKPGINVGDVFTELSQSDVAALQKIQESFLPQHQESSVLQSAPFDETLISSSSPPCKTAELYPALIDVPHLEKMMKVNTQTALSTPVLSFTIPDKGEKTPLECVKPIATIERDPGYQSVLPHKPDVNAEYVSQINILTKPAVDKAKRKQQRKRNQGLVDSFTTPHTFPIQKQLDLVFVGAPRTPMTPALKIFMTPSRSDPTLVRLNSISTGVPLYMVHPVTGTLTLLQPVGMKLKVPCIGVQMSSSTPRTSVKDIASFYRKCIEEENPQGPYRILGYSFGGMIAFEIARQLQDANKTVEYLIMLDGSPEWAHGQTKRIRQIHIPEGTPDHMVADLLEVGSIMWYMELFGPIPHREMVQEALEQIPNLSARAALAVDICMGNVLVSPSPQKTKWLAAKSRIQQNRNHLKMVKEGVYNSAKEFIRLTREKKAIETVQIRKIIDDYEVNDKFEGDIYLLRLKCEPRNSTPLSLDYGLVPHCTGKVHITYFDGNHETFLCGENSKAVINELNTILCPNMN